MVIVASLIISRKALEKKNSPNIWVMMPMTANPLMETECWISIIQSILIRKLITNFGTMLTNWKLKWVQAWAEEKVHFRRQVDRECLVYFLRLLAMPVACRGEEHPIWELLLIIQPGKILISQIDNRQRLWNRHVGQDLPQSKLLFHSLLKCKLHHRQHLKL
jgi:hypothetical protein